MVAAVKRRPVPLPLCVGLVWFKNKRKIDFRAAEKSERFQGRRCSGLIEKSFQARTTGFG